MKLRTSFFSGIVYVPIIRANLRQFGLISMLASLVLLFLIPTQIVLKNPINPFFYSSNERYYLSDDMNSTMMYWTIIALAIGIGLLQTRYLQVKKTSDWLHSLPIKRQILLLNQIISGSMLLLIPIFITSVATFVTTHFFYQEGVTNLTSWISLTLFSLLIYVFTVLIGTFTGQTIVQGGMVILILFSPTLVMVVSQIELFFYGFSLDHTSNSLYSVAPGFEQALISKLPWSSNIEYILQSIFFNNKLLNLNTLFYVLMMIVMVAVAMWVSTKRPLERANETICLKYVAPILKYMFTLGAMLIVGSYFSTYVFDSSGNPVVNNNFLLTRLYIGYVIGAVLGYIIAEMVSRGNWRMFDWHALRGLLVFGIVVFSILLALRADITGYVHRIPETSDIENIFIKDLNLNDYWLINEDLMRMNVSRSYIEDVRKLHKKIVTDQLRENAQTSYVSLSILYKLKNGSELARSYTFPIDFSDPDFKSVTDSPYFKRSVWDLDTIVSSEALSLELDAVIPSPYYHQPMRIEDSKELKEILPIIVEEVMNQTYEEMYFEMDLWGSIDINLKAQGNGNDSIDTFNFRWNKSYHKLNAWLQAKGLLRQARNIPAKLEFVDLYIQKDLMTYSLRKSIKIPTDITFPEIKTWSGTCIFLRRISDPAQIEELLNKSSSSETENTDYVIHIPLTKENDHFHPLYLDSSDLPSFLK